MNLARRRFLSLLPAPAIVRAASLMAVVPVVAPAFKVVPFVPITNGGTGATLAYARVGNIITISGLIPANAPVSVQFSHIFLPTT